MKTTILCAVLLMHTATVAIAGPGAHIEVAHAGFSGVHQGGSAGTRVAWSHEIDLGDVPWIRVGFDRVRLGMASHVEIHGEGEGQFQRLDARTMREWFHGSALFRGGRVRIELHVAPHDRDVQVGIAKLVHGDGVLSKTACGEDERFPLLDNRVARINASGCTAWAIGNGAYLTAGHCVDFDPDDGGPMVPDGILDLSGVLEFNVPLSNPDGSLNPSAPNDQYPINLATVTWRFDGNGTGLGKDWAIFAVNRNANTGLLPYQAYGVAPLRITREIPAVGTNLRITGFGTDSGLANQTSQVGFGPFMGESSAGPDIWLLHRVDTQGGNSGSPIVWEDLGLAIGIHTNGGCSGESGENAGCSFEVDALENAIDNFLGTSAEHVDPAHPLPMTRDGSLHRPWATLADGIAQVETNGNVVIYPGVVGFPAGAVITAPCTLRAGGGDVYVVGN